MNVYPRPTISVVVLRRVGIVIPLPDINALTIDPPVIPPSIVNINDPLHRPIMFDDINVASPIPVVVVVAIYNMTAFDMGHAITSDHTTVMSDNATINPTVMSDNATVNATVVSDNAFPFYMGGIFFVLRFPRAYCGQGEHGDDAVEK